MCVANFSFSEPTTYHCLPEFTSVSEESLNKIICRSSIKSCTLDPIPAKLLKCILPTLLPVIVKIINLSLMSGVMPECFKTEMVFPILKKPQLDSQILNNYRPVSNLPFLLEVVERIVAAQLTEYLNHHSLTEPLQSAYRQYQCHSIRRKLCYWCCLTCRQLPTLLITSC